MKTESDPEFLNMLKEMSMKVPPSVNPDVQRIMDLNKAMKKVGKSES